MRPELEPKKSAAEKRAESIQAVKDGAQESGFEFFCDSYDNAYATVPQNKHQETWRVREAKFRYWV